MVNHQVKIRYFASTIFTIIVIGVGVYEFFYDEIQNPVLLTYLMLVTVWLFSFRWFSTLLSWLLNPRLFLRERKIIWEKIKRSMGIVPLKLSTIPDNKRTPLTKAADRIFLMGIFISMTSALSVLASRCYLDIAFGGSWIEYFREHAGKFPNIQLHRLIDFVYHYLPFAVLSSLFFVYYDDLKKFVIKASNLTLSLPILVSLGTFMIWAWKYDLKDIYHALNIQDWHIGLLILGVGIFMVLPFQLFLRGEEKVKRTKTLYDLTFIIVSFVHVLVGISVFKWEALFTNLIFWSSLCAFIFSVFKFIFQGEKKVVYAAVFTMSFIYSSFFITEVYLWSLGGSHNFFYEMIEERSYFNPRTLYFVHKGMFYVLILYFVTMSYIRTLHNTPKTIKDFTRNDVKFTYKIGAAVVSFFTTWGIFKHPEFYDVAFTNQDSLLFLAVSTVITLMMIFPLTLKTVDRHVL